jgi:hypothetical protein
VLSPDLASVLQRRGVQPPVTAKRRIAYKKLERGARSLPTQTQKKNVEDSRKAVAKQLDGSAVRLQELRQAVTEGGLRPHKAAPPVRRFSIEPSEEVR